MSLNPFKSVSDSLEDDLNMLNDDGPNIIKKGYLFHADHNVETEFKSFYAVLTSEDLRLWKDEKSWRNGNTRLYAISLKSGDIRLEGSVEFIHYSHNRFHYFKADDKYDRKEWVDKLNKILGVDTGKETLSNTIVYNKTETESVYLGAKALEHYQTGSKLSIKESMKNLKEGKIEHVSTSSDEIKSPLSPRKELRKQHSASSKLDSSDNHLFQKKLGPKSKSESKTLVKAEEHPEMPLSDESFNVGPDGTHSNPQLIAKHDDLGGSTSKSDLVMIQPSLHLDLKEKIEKLKGLHDTPDIKPLPFKNPVLSPVENELLSKLDVPIVTETNESKTDLVVESKNDDQILDQINKE